MNDSCVPVVIFLTFIAISMLSWVPTLEGSPSPRKRVGVEENKYGGGRSSYSSGSYYFGYEVSKKVCFKFLFGRKMNK